MDEDERLVRLPEESSVVVVNQAQDSAVDDEPAMRYRVLQKPSPYEAVGKIVPPREPDVNSGDADNFQKAVGILELKHANEDGIDFALSHLSELAHDIYYGVELVKRGESLR